MPLLIDWHGWTHSRRPLQLESLNCENSLKKSMLTNEPLAKLNKTVTQAEAEGQKPLKNLL
jgi:hypothetical protein